MFSKMLAACLSFAATSAFAAGQASACAWQRYSDGYDRAYCNAQWYLRAANGVFVWQGGVWTLTSIAQPVRSPQWVCWAPGQDESEAQPCDGPASPASGSGNRWVDHYSNYGGYQPYAGHVDSYGRWVPHP